MINSPRQQPETEALAKIEPVRSDLQRSVDDGRRSLPLDDRSWTGGLASSRFSMIDFQ
jgi:hypothetical protein